MTLLIERAPQTAQATAISVMAIGSAAGAALCGLIATMVVPQFGWRAMFVIGGLLPFVLLPLVRIALPGDDRTVGGGPDRPAPTSGAPRRASLFAQGRWTTTLVLWAAFFLFAMPLFFLIAWLPSIGRDHGFTTGQAASATALFHLSGAIGAIVAGRLVDRIGRPAVIPIAIGAVIAVLALSQAPNGSSFLAASALSGFLVMGIQAPLCIITGESYPAAIRGLGVGSGLGVMRIGAAVSPWIGGVLMDAGLGPRSLLLLAGACVALDGTIVSLLALRTTELPLRRRQREPGRG